MHNEKPVLLVKVEKFTFHDYNTERYFIDESTFIAIFSGEVDHFQIRGVMQ